MSRPHGKRFVIAMVAMSVAPTIFLMQPVAGLAYRIDIHVAGRPTGPTAWESRAFEEYRDRLRGTVELETTYHKTGAALEKALAKVSHPVIVCDPAGPACDSVSLSRLLFAKLDAEGSRLTLGVGPAEGFSSAARRDHECLSLSALTFPHQLVRVILAEQIYRAAEIRRGSPYHK